MRAVDNILAAVPACRTVLTALETGLTDPLVLSAARALRSVRSAWPILILISAVADILLDGGRGGNGENAADTEGDHGISPAIGSVTQNDILAIVHRCRSFVRGAQDKSLICEVFPISIFFFLFFEFAPFIPLEFSSTR